MELTRQDKILKMIVDSFIKTAQPVGSKTLIEQYHLTISSATIRNEMNALEKLGYLEKTHTSSGRVPSSAGYKYYVENLRDKAIDEEFKNQLAAVLDSKTKAIEEVIQEACEILANMTNLASVVIGPNADSEHLISIQIIPISDKSATAVFVTDKGYVENKTFIIDEKMSVEDIQKCVSLMNDRLKGTSISDLIPKMEGLKPILNDYIVGHDVIYQAIMQAFLRFASDRLALYGQENLLNQPEFINDSEKFAKLIKLIESPDELAKVLDIKEMTSDIGVSIGDDDKDVAVITANLNVGGVEEGKIALVGPRRMDYEKVVSSLEYIAQQLRKFQTNNNDKGGKDECQKTIKKKTKSSKSKK